ncbi:MAG: helix-turn-helix transcriptional regulator [Actinomycetota bacterium]
MPKSTKVVGLDWLYRKMDEHEYSSLQAVAEACELNRGNLYRYFSFETRPSIDLLPKLCNGLNASPLEVLTALGIQFD